MSLPPETSSSLSLSPPPDGSALCLACGLCCTGILHAHARLVATETGLAGSLGLTVEPWKDRFRFQLPCPLYQNNCCSIYTAPRPHVCGDYRCELLKKFQTETLSLEQSIQIVRRAQQLLADAGTLLPPGVTLARFRQEVESAAAPHPPALMLAWVSLERYLHKHFDSTRHPNSGASS